MQPLHRLRFLLLALVLGLSAATAQAQITGLVVDTAKAPLPMVQIFDRDGAILGQTRVDGYFKLDLRTGTYKLVFSHPDFYSTEIPLVVRYNTKDTLNIMLTPKTEKIQGAEIIREYIETLDGAITYDGCDSALVGTAKVIREKQWVEIAIYSYERLVEHFKNEYLNDSENPILEEEAETDAFEFTATSKSSLLLIEVPMQW